MPEDFAKCHAYGSIAEHEAQSWESQTSKEPSCNSKGKNGNGVKQNSNALDKRDKFSES